MQKQIGMNSCTWLLPAALLALCALAISACGGGGPSKHASAASAVAGATGATGAAGTTSGGAKPPKVSTGATGATSLRPRAGARSHKRRTNSGTPTSSTGNGSPKHPKPSGGTKGGANKSPKRPIIKAVGPPSSYANQQTELAREAKIVCGALTLDGLAHEYGVARTPDAAARAYARGYDATLRGAAYRGCKSAFVK